MSRCSQTTYDWVARDQRKRSVWWRRDEKRRDCAWQTDKRGGEQLWWGQPKREERSQTDENEMEWKEGTGAIMTGWWQTMPDNNDWGEEDRDARLGWRTEAEKWKKGGKEGTEGRCVNEATEVRTPMHVRWRGLRDSAHQRREERCVEEEEWMIEDGMRQKRRGGGDEGTEEGMAAKEEAC